ncbi:hypothetical protein [Streptomyces sp. LS1784]|uniref:hypothetical protein n=1 Tax=Streptomyces sp. LS1784 TaxID=2851533 RepID=UPI001CCB141D|nr:hypothetical protein [Streptomyces sp. LS1784]
MSHTTAAGRFLSPAAAMLVAALTAGAMVATVSGAHAAWSERPGAHVAAPAQPADSAVNKVPAKLQNLTDAEFEQLVTAAYEPYLTQLEAVPDTIVDQGGDAVIIRLKQQIAEAPGPRYGDTRAVQAGWFDIKCIGLVTAAAAGTLLPASKVWKVAKILKKYGVRRVVNAIKGIRKGQGATVGADLKDAALILLGLDGIQQACS